MHKFDRTQLESDFDEEFEQEFESEFENEFEDEFEDEYEAEFEDEFEDEFEYEQAAGRAAMVFSGDEEMELAAELLEVTDDEEMEQFLGRLIKRAAKRVRRGVKRIGKRTRGIRRRFRRRLGKRLKSGLRKLARRGLQAAGRVGGTFLGGPIGGAVGAKVGSGLANAFGLELEGLSPEDQEFEGARQFIRLAGDAVAEAADISEEVDDDEAGDMAMRAALRRHAPGLGRRGRRGRGAGKWVRKGRKIVVLGA